MCKAVSEIPPFTSWAPGHFISKNVQSPAWIVQVEDESRASQNTSSLGFCWIGQKNKNKFKKEENVAFLAAFFPSTGIH